MKLTAKVETTIRHLLCQWRSAIFTAIWIWIKQLYLFMLGYSHSRYHPFWGKQLNQWTLKCVLVTHWRKHNGIRTVSTGFESKMGDAVWVDLYQSCYTEQLCCLLGNNNVNIIIIIYALKKYMDPIKGLLKLNCLDKHCVIFIKRVNCMFTKQFLEHDCCLFLIRYYSTFARTFVLFSLRPIMVDNFPK